MALFQQRWVPSQPSSLHFAASPAAEGRAGTGEDAAGEEPRCRSRRETNSGRAARRRSRVLGCSRRSRSSAIRRRAASRGALRALLREHPPLPPTAAAAWGCRSSGERPPPRGAFSVPPPTLSSSPVLTAKMLQRLKSLRFAPPSKEEPGQGAPGPGAGGLCHRDRWPWLCIPLVPLTRVSHPTTRTFCSTGGSHPFLFTRSVLAALWLLPVADILLVPRAGSHLRTRSRRDATRPPSHRCRAVAGTPQERWPQHSGFPGSAGAHCPRPLSQSRSALGPTTRLLPRLVNGFLGAKCPTLLATQDKCSDGFPDGSPDADPTFPPAPRRLRGPGLRRDGGLPGASSGEGPLQSPTRGTPSAPAPTQLSHCPHSAFPRGQTPLRERCRWAALGLPSLLTLCPRAVLGPQQSIAPRRSCTRAAPVPQPQGLRPLEQSPGTRRPHTAEPRAPAPLTPCSLFLLP